MRASTSAHRTGWGPGMVRSFSDILGLSFPEARSTWVAPLIPATGSLLRVTTPYIDPAVRHRPESGSDRIALAFNARRVCSGLPDLATLCGVGLSALADGAHHREVDHGLASRRNEQAERSIIAPYLAYADKLRKTA